MLYYVETGIIRYKIAECNFLIAAIRVLNIAYKKGETMLSKNISINPYGYNYELMKPLTYYICSKCNHLQTKIPLCENCGNNEIKAKNIYLDKDYIQSRVKKTERISDINTIYDNNGYKVKDINHTVLLSTIDVVRLAGLSVSDFKILS